MTAKEITERIYKMYGTDSGWLFGFAPEDRITVEMIIKIALKIDKEEK